MKRLSRFKLQEEESGRIKIERDDVVSCKEEGRRSLVGRLWGSKSANFSGLKNTVSSLWCQNGSLKVVELGQNFFQFVFSDLREKERVWQRRPWHFDSQLIVLHEWMENIEECDAIFARAPMWLQVKGVPNHWCSKKVGWKIGKLFPHCLNVVIPESGSREGKMIKLFVELNLNKPLLRGTKIMLDEKTVWVDFRYEQLPLSCFYCGVIGHAERGCQRKISDAREGAVCEGQFGDWIRAPPQRSGNRADMAGSGGRKVRESGELGEGSGESRNLISKNEREGKGGKEPVSEEIVSQWVTREGELRVREEVIGIEDEVHRSKALHEGGEERMGEKGTREGGGGRKEKGEEGYVRGEEGEGGKAEQGSNAGLESQENGSETRIGTEMFVDLQSYRGKIVENPLREIDQNVRQAHEGAQKGEGKGSTGSWRRWVRQGKMEVDSVREEDKVMGGRQNRKRGGEFESDEGLEQRKEGGEGKGPKAIKKTYFRITMWWR